MRKITKIWITVSIAFACIGAASLAYGDWSMEWNAVKESKPPPIVDWSQKWRITDGIFLFSGVFTKVEFFILDVAHAGVTFEKDTSISPPRGGWISELPNPGYSLLYGNPARLFFSPESYLTTFFNDPGHAGFELVLIAWNGNHPVEEEEFKWLGNRWQNPLGTPINTNPDNFDRSGGGAISIPSAILLFAPGALVVLLLRKRLTGNKAKASQPATT